MHSPRPFLALLLLWLDERSQREIADKMREILTRGYPGVQFLQWPGGLVASVFSNGYNAPIVVEVRGDRLEVPLQLHGGCLVCGSGVDKQGHGGSHSHPR